MYRMQGGKVRGEGRALDGLRCGRRCVHNRMAGVVCVPCFHCQHEQGSAVSTFLVVLSLRRAPCPTLARAVLELLTDSLSNLAPLTISAAPAAVLLPAAPWSSLRGS